jgi:hypothetical protein
MTWFSVQQSEGFKRWRERFLAEWAGLNAKLGLLETAQLTEDQMAAIYTGRRDHYNDDFQRELPFTVARFTKAATDEVCRVLKEKRRDDGLGKPVLDEGWASRFSEDVAQINALFFNSALVDSDARLGMFTQALAEELHGDRCFDQDITPFYIARVKALPFLILKPDLKDEARKRVAVLVSEMTGEERRSLKLADYNMLSRRTTAVLRREGLLVPSNLGDVFLLVARRIGKEGTPHASSPVRQPTSSAYFTAAVSFG